MNELSLDDLPMDDILRIRYIEQAIKWLDSHPVCFSEAANQVNAALFSTFGSRTHPLTAHTMERLYYRWTHGTKIAAPMTWQTLFEPLALTPKRRNSGGAARNKAL